MRQEITSIYPNYSFTISKDDELLLLRLLWLLDAGVQKVIFATHKSTIDVTVYNKYEMR